MVPRRRIMLGLGVFLMACGGGTTVAERPWIQVSTRSFNVTSSMDQETTLEVAIGLERFRALVYLILGPPNLAAPVPTEIYLFEKPYEYRDFTPNRNVAGFFSPGMRHNIATAVKTKGMDLSQIMYHEYVHFILRNASAAQYPLWYDEGFAEFLSASFVEGDRIWVGAVPEHRVMSFRHGWIGLERIVAAGSYGDFKRDDLHLVYAESWALVHYLVLQREGRHNINEELSRFLNLVNQGEDTSSAFEQAFGERPTKVGKALQRELNRGRLRRIGIPLDALPLSGEAPEIRTVSPLEIAVRLGQLALSVGKGDVAQGFFETAVRLDPTDPRALAGLGDAHKFQDRYEVARPYFERSIELAPDDALTQLDYAEFLHNMALEDEFEARQGELLDEARQHYVKAWKLDDELPETYAMYGRTFLPRGQDESKCLQMLGKAHSLLPSNPEILEMLAGCFIANGDEHRARVLVDRIVAWSTHSGDREEEVQRRMKELFEQYARTGESEGEA